MKNIWDSLAGPVRRPYGHRTGSMWIMRIIWSKHKCTAVSSRTGPVAWCDHDNNTGVKFLRALHSALRARNRTGVKNRTGPVVGCDWGINDWVNNRESGDLRHRDHYDVNVMLFWADCQTRKTPQLSERTEYTPICTCRSTNLAWSKFNQQPHGWGTTQRREWILDELRNRFCAIFATDSWQRTRGHDECVHKMTNIIHNYRFVKPY